MTSKELRKSFLDFFEKKGHKIVSSSALLPTDQSVLFTTAGMQQFKPYYLGAKSPYGSNVCSCQKCFRTSDIEEVGDENHLTFLEMLGNFSFGGYFKEEAIKLALQFLVENCKLSIENFSVTVFSGDKKIPRDEESIKIWRKFGFSEEKGNLSFKGKEDNFWGPTGKDGPCGPTTEIHIGGVELWNLVFNEYYQDEKGILTPLKQKGVDTGMGLERLAMISQGKNSVYDTDLFFPITREMRNWKLENGNRELSERSERIIADHIKSAVFLISEGIFPSNVERGYVLRRILRRAIRYGKLLNLPKQFLIPLAEKVIGIYQDVYPELRSKQADILTILQTEEEKFEKTLHEGLKQFDAIISAHQEKLKIAPSKTKIITGKEAFDLYQSYGFPLELTKELAKERGFETDEKKFEEEFKKHQQVSRAGVEKKFGGGGIFSPKLHTATHLLQAALREVLGKHIRQMGSDITSQRLRFDFTHSQKMTKEEIKKVEDLVNQKIAEDLEVKKEEMPYEEAVQKGFLAFAFEEKQFVAKKGQKIVTVYTIGDFSKEVCAGPHAKRTSELNHFQIIKEESCGAGIRRIRAILE